MRSFWSIFVRASFRLFWVWSMTAFSLRLSGSMTTNILVKTTPTTRTPATNDRRMNFPFRARVPLQEPYKSLAIFTGARIDARRGFTFLPRENSDDIILGTSTSRFTGLTGFGFLTASSLWLSIERYNAPQSKSGFVSFTEFIFSANCPASDLKRSAFMAFSLAVTMLLG